MARSTRKSLAGSAATAAKKVMSRRARPAEQESAPAKKAPAKKTPEKKTSAKKVPVKEAPAKKAPVKKTSVKKTSAKKAPVKKAPVKKTSAKKTPAKKAPARKTSARKAAPVASTSAPVNKVAASSLAVLQGEESWTKAELQEVLSDLHEHRERLEAEVHDQEEELAGLMRDAGDGAGQDQADMGATSFERDHELTVVNNARDMISQIDRALGRIDDGTYGVCESCGQPIGKMRLMAFPRATLCLSCKQREERR